MRVCRVCGGDCAHDTVIDSLTRKLGFLRAAAKALVDHHDKMHAKWADEARKAGYDYLQVEHVLMLNLRAALSPPAPASPPDPVTGTGSGAAP